MKMIGNVSTIEEVKEDENEDEDVLNESGLGSDSFENELKKKEKSQSKEK
jgi:hypothetical protein